MSDWNSMQIGNQCNSLRNNAVHNRFGFHLSLYSTGNRVHILSLYHIHILSADKFLRYFHFDIENWRQSRALDPH